MGTLIKYCEVCGKQFVPYRDFHKRCSNRCRKIAEEKDYRYKKKPTVTKVCKQCSQEFETNIKKKEYCCAQCQEIHRLNSYKPKKATEKVCKNCGQTFETTHHAKNYCCSDCYTEAKKKRQKKARNA